MADKWKGAIWRTLVAFWLLGLCNNMGYVVMLSGAHDILEQFDEDDHIQPSYNRECNELGTGVILIADILPAIIIKSAAPFLPLMVGVRMACVVITSAAGFLLVGLQLNKWSVLLGVVLTSLSCGLGETTILSYMVFFPTYNVISTWSSGTGGAGIIGAGLYLLLTTVCDVSTKVTVLSMLAVPLIQGAAFFFMVEHPRMSLLHEGTAEHIPKEADPLTFREKLRVLPKLIQYFMAPFGLVYLFEYFINQGLFELMYYPKTFLDHNDQYRCYQFIYQLGVFVSRSSMNIVRINWLWGLAMFQLANLILLLFEVFYGFLYYLVIAFFIVLWEGLVGGAAYVNSYRRIAEEYPPREKQFCMAITGVADASMITLAGVIAAPVHNLICDTEKNYEY